VLIVSAIVGPILPPQQHAKYGSRDVVAALHLPTGFVNATTLQMVLLCAHARMSLSTRTSATDTFVPPVCCEVNSTTPVSSLPGYCRPFMMEYVTELLCPKGTYVRLELCVGLPGKHPVVLWRCFADCPMSSWRLLWRRLYCCDHPSRE
jgi:hypothetical protein